MYNFCLLVYAKGEGQTPQINEKCLFALQYGYYALCFQSKILFLAFQILGGGQGTAFDTQAHNLTLISLHLDFIDT